MRSNPFLSRLLGILVGIVLYNVVAVLVFDRQFVLSDFLLMVVIVGGLSAVVLALTGPSGRKRETHDE